MPANTSPIFTLTPTIEATKIGTTSAQVKSDGTCAGTGTDLMYCAFSSGANGSFVSRVRFSVVASAANVTSVATVLRVYWTTVSGTPGSAMGATTSSNTFLLAEFSVPAIAASNATNATSFFEVPINMAFPTGVYITVSQHTAQTTNQQWQAQVFAGDY